MNSKLNFLILITVVLGSLVGCAHVQPSETQSIHLLPGELVKNVSPGDSLIVYMRSGSNYSLIVENIDAVKITGGDKELFIKDISSVTKQVVEFREKEKTKFEKEGEFWGGIYLIVAIIALFSSLAGGAGSFP